MIAIANIEPIALSIVEGCARTARSNVHPEDAFARGFFARLASGTFFDQAPRWLAKAGEFVNLKGVYPPVPDTDKIEFVEMDDLGEPTREKRKNTKNCLYARARLAFHFRQNLP
jgi:hypothetical protein